ncbi:uncharacterized protein LOC103676264 isoform X2 [Ursus maritimus]|uniref:Uncharacterized protein LOC103676264 isoform X2 n=1 Tax=Ursus maritimus TaxID=29073 RepID=A0A8M1H1I2_URSMA|nr:uncharacterized protein LOC103676264 isoform X2 [Ursus maritimus]
MNPELLTGANHLSCRRGTELHPRERHGVDSSERKYGVKDTENEAPLKPCRCYVRKHVEVEDTIRPCLDLERETGSLRLLACAILMLPFTLCRMECLSLKQPRTGQQTQQACFSS